MNLALFLPGWVGDVVMATPAIRAVRRQYPDARLIGVCKSYVAGVLEGAPWFQEVISVERAASWSSGWLAVLRKLRRADIDLALLFPNSFRSALVAWLARCRRRIGFARYGRGLLLTDALQPRRDTSGKRVPTPIIDDYNRLAQGAGCPWPGHEMELFTTRADERAADRFWQRWELGGEVICFNPGAAFGSAKQWPVQSFAALARLLIERRRSNIVVLSGPSELPIAQRIVRLAACPGIYSLTDEPLSIGLTKALVRRSDLLVTTDSGPRHFAAAFGRPVITLFGPTFIEWTETYYPEAIHLQKQVPCGPCQKRVCPLDHRCMNELSPMEVFVAVETLLNRRRRHGQRKAS